MKIPARRPLLLALAALALAAAAPRALACSCAPPGEPRAELAAADAVFAGRVVSVEPQEAAAFPRLAVRFALKAVWKGLPEGDEATLTTAADSAACGYHFEEGEEYLVYAYRSDDGDLTTSLCSRNARLDQAAADLAAFGEPARSPAAAATKP
jgi:hypothetical protein